MSLIRKLKPDRNITMLLVYLSIFPIFGIASLIFGIHIGLMILALFLFGFSLLYLYAFFRTGNPAQLAVCADGLFFGVMLLIIDPDSGWNTREYGLAYFLGILFFGILLAFLVFTRKFKWRGREVFELTAESIEETGNGYTSRPRPVGKVEYNQQEIQAFVRFLSRHLIALPYPTSKNTTLVIVKMGEEFSRLLGLSGDYRDATWVNFDRDGNVSVHIAQKDYLDYREPLAFDQLCTSLGLLFIEFFDLYRKGEGIRVIDRMDDLRLPALS